MMFGNPSRLRKCKSRKVYIVINKSMLARTKAVIVHCTPPLWFAKEQMNNSPPLTHHAIRIQREVATEHITSSDGWLEGEQGGTHDRVAVRLSITFLCRVTPVCSLLLALESPNNTNECTFDCPWLDRIRLARICACWSIAESQLSVQPRKEGCRGLTTAHEKVVGVSLWVIEWCPHAGSPGWCGIRSASYTALITLFIWVFVALSIFREFFIVVHPC